MSTSTAFQNQQNPPLSQYLKTKVLTAGPADLRLLLLDGAIKFARQGREGIAKKDYEAMFNGISQCRDIVVELMTTIAPSVEPSLAQKVRGVLTFMFTELTNASMERSVDKMDRIIGLLEFERETWAMLIDKLKTEQAGTKAPNTALSLAG